MTDIASKIVPVNIVTGFLGVGKTTTIRHLLKAKPKSEKWAVLVNEFGEVGIDGAILHSDGITIEEVTGGCICCSIRLPSSRAMQKLINQIQPDRIIIEPTGLALPQQILQMLSRPPLVQRIQIQATICLVDPWCFDDNRLLQLPTFIAQLNAADVLVATKQDIANPSHLAAFTRYATNTTPRLQAYFAISHGALDPKYLRLPHRPNSQSTTAPHSTTEHVHTHHADSADNTTDTMDGSGVLRIENQADFGCSCGWQFNEQWCFDSNKLLSLFQTLTVPRIKGIFALRKGWILINKMRDTISSESVDSDKDSRVEMISVAPCDWHAIDKQLRACKVNWVCA